MVIHTNWQSALCCGLAVKIVGPFATMCNFRCAFEADASNSPKIRDCIMLILRVHKYQVQFSQLAEY